MLFSQICTVLFFLWIPANIVGLFLEEKYNVDFVFSIWWLGLGMMLFLISIPYIETI